MGKHEEGRTGSLSPESKNEILDRLRRSYVLALGLIALLLVGQGLLSQRSLVFQEQDAHLINLSGRQRMLSQRLTKELLLLKDAEVDRDREILHIVNQWTQAHDAISRYSVSPQSTELLNQLTPLVDQIAESGLRYSQGRDPAMLAEVLELEPRFLGLMEKLVESFESEARDRLARQRTQQFLIIGFLLAVLVAEIFIIFRPLAGALKETIVNLENQQKKTEEALQKSEQAARLKSEFLANLSHEVRTPMNGILGTSDLLLSSGLEGQTRDLALLIQNSAESLLHTMNDIVDISKIQAGQLTLRERKFDFYTLLEEISELNSLTAAKRGLDYVCHIAPSTPLSIETDPLRLRQILMNLVSNAVKFTDDGGVVVKVWSEGERLYIRVSDTGCGIPEADIPRIFEPFEQLDGSHTRRHAGTGLGLSIASRLAELMQGEIEVESQPGIGSSFEFRFSPVFHQGDIQEGLSIGPARLILFSSSEERKSFLDDWCRQWKIAFSAVDSAARLEETLKQQSDDTVVLIDSPYLAEVSYIPKGCCSAALLPPGQKKNGISGFTETLTKPLRIRELADFLKKTCEQRACCESDVAASKSADFPSFKGHVLVVEDAKPNQLISTRMLEKFGLDHTVAENGQQALQICQKEAFDLILMDCQMPVMDGYEATRQLRESGNDVPIVALTANAMSYDRELCLDAGMNGYLSKPLRRKNLEEVLKTFLR